MKRTCSIFFFPILLCVLNAWSDTKLPVGNSPKPIEFTHFPSRMHAFVWRNWPIVPVERLANVVETTPQNIRDLAISMGLSKQEPVAFEHWNRIYITLIRRNWHLLPYKQLLQLLDMTSEELAHSLREDDFLYIKLGSLKPACEPLRYTPPTSRQEKRCAEIKAIVDETFTHPQEDRFHFIQKFSQVQSKQTNDSSRTNSQFSPRYVYSYFALYGDPLMDSELESFPEGLLQRLSEMGVDGIWIHSVLRQ